MVNRIVTASRTWILVCSISILVELSIIFFLQTLHLDQVEHTLVGFKLLVIESVELKQLIFLLNLGEMLTGFLSDLQTWDNVIFFYHKESLESLSPQMLFGQTIKRHPQVFISLSDLFLQAFNHLQWGIEFLAIPQSRNLYLELLNLFFEHLVLVEQRWLL